MDDWVGCKLAKKQKNNNEYYPTQSGTKTFHFLLKFREILIAMRITINGIIEKGDIDNYTYHHTYY